MGNFFATGLKASSKTSRILLLGLDEAGKTCLLRQLSGYVGAAGGDRERKYGDVVPLAPTHGFQIHTLQYKGFRMEVVDIGGTKENRPHWRKYYDNVHGIIFVIDAADRRRFEEAGVALEEVLEDERLANVPLLIFANKQDKVMAVGEHRLSEGLNLHHIRGRTWQCVGCSCVTAPNRGADDKGNMKSIQSSFQWLVRTMARLAGVDVDQ